MESIIERTTTKIMRTMDHNIDIPNIQRNYLYFLAFKEEVIKMINIMDDIFKFVSIIQIYNLRKEGKD